MTRRRRCSAIDRGIALAARARRRRRRDRRARRDGHREHDRRRPRSPRPSSAPSRRLYAAREPGSTPRGSSARSTPCGAALAVNGVTRAGATRSTRSPRWADSRSRSSRRDPRRGRAPSGRSCSTGSSRGAAALRGRRIATGERRLDGRGARARPSPGMRSCSRRSGSSRSSISGCASGRAAARRWRCRSCAPAVAILDEMATFDVGRCEWASRAPGRPPVPAVADA